MYSNCLKSFYDYQAEKSGFLLKFSYYIRNRKLTRPTSKAVAEEVSKVCCINKSFFFSFSLRESYSTLKTGFWRTEIQLSYTHRNTWENIRRPKSFWVTNRRDPRIPAAHPQWHGSRTLCHSSTQTSPPLPVEAVAIFKMDFFHIYHQEAVWRCVIGHLVRQDTPLFFPKLYYIPRIIWARGSSSSREQQQRERCLQNTVERDIQLPFLTAVSVSFPYSTYSSWQTRTLMEEWLH